MTDQTFPAIDTVSRGSRQQPRAFDDGRGVRVVGEDGTLINICVPSQLHKYLTAPNAKVKRRKDGSIRHITLLSAGDDRGHLGENHGRSTVTTEQADKEWGGLLQGRQNLQHKKSWIWEPGSTKVR